MTGVVNFTQSPAAVAFRATHCPPLELLSVSTLVRGPLVSTASSSASRAAGTTGPGGGGGDGGGGRDGPGGGDAGGSGGALPARRSHSCASYSERGISSPLFSSCTPAGP